MIRLATLLALATIALADAGLRPPFEDTDMAGPRQFFTYQIAATTPTKYVVRGSGVGNLDCAVSRDGQRLATDHGPDDGCSMVVFETGQLMLKVHNRGRDATIFRLKVTPLEGDKI